MSQLSRTSSERSTARADPSDSTGLGDDLHSEIPIHSERAQTNRSSPVGASEGRPRPTALYRSDYIPGEARPSPSLFPSSTTSGPGGRSIVTLPPPTRLNAESVSYPLTSHPPTTRPALFPVHPPIATLNPPPRYSHASPVPKKLEGASTNMSDRLHHPQHSATSNLSAASAHAASSAKDAKDTNALKRTKTSRACDPCRRKKIRQACDSSLGA
jgi:hypothetical protein